MDVYAQILMVVNPSQQTGLRLRCMRKRKRDNGTGFVFTQGYGTYIQLFLFLWFACGVLNFPAGTFNGTMTVVDLTKGYYMYSDQAGHTVQLESFAD